MAFDLIGARNEGYTDQEIADYLAQTTPDFDVSGAYSEGYSLDEIVGHLVTPTPAPARAPELVAPEFEPEPAVTTAVEQPYFPPPPKELPEQVEPPIPVSRPAVPRAPEVQIGPPELRPPTPEEEKRFATPTPQERAISEAAFWREQLKRTAGKPGEQKAVATLAGIAETVIPGLALIEPTAEIESAMTARPEMAAVGKMVGSVGEAFLYAPGIKGLLSKAPALAKNKLLLNVLTRMGTSVAMNTPEEAIAALQDKQTWSDAFWNTMQTAGGAAVSVLPEMIPGFKIPGTGMNVPWQAVQLIGQPMVDLAYEATVDELRGIDVNTKEWVYNKGLPTLGMAGGFALVDVASGARFKAEQRDIRRDAKKAFTGMLRFLKRHPDAQISGIEPRIEPEMPPAPPRVREPVEPEFEERRKDTRMFVIDEFKRQKLEGAETRAEDFIQKLSPDEMALLSGIKEVAEEAGIDALTGTLNRLGGMRRGHFIPEPGKEHLKRPPLIPVDKRQYLIDIDFFKRINDKYGHDVGDDVLARLGETLNESWGADADVVRFGGEEFLSFPLTDIPEDVIINRIESIRQQFGQEIFADGKLTGVNFSAGIGDDFKQADRALYLAKDQGRGRTIVYQEDIHDKQTFPDTEPAERADIKEAPAPRRKAPKAPPAAPPAKVKPPKPPVEEVVKPETAAEELDIPTKQVPGQKKEDPEFTRKRGFMAISGAVGGEKQKKVKGEAARVQKKFEAQRQKVKTAFETTREDFIDKNLSRFLDVNAPVKRRLLKYAKGKEVVMKHDLIRGASAEAKQQYEFAEDDVSKTIPHNAEHIFNDFLQSKRTIEVEELKELRGEKIKSPISGEESKTWLNELEKSDPKLFKNLQTAANKYWKKMHNQIEQLYDEGLIDAKLRDQLLKEHKYYTPRQFLQHIDPDNISFDSQGRVVNVPDSGLKRLDEGSENALVNNFRLSLGNTIARTQARIFKNRANKSLYEFAKETPDNSLDIKIEQPIGKTKEGKLKYGPVPTGFTRISAMINGQRKNMLMPTKMAQYWVLQDPLVDSEIANVVRIASGAPILKAMATGYNPEFALSNIPRDLMYSWFRTKEYSPILPVAWAQQAVDYATVLKDVVTRGPRVQDYIRQGGGMDFLTQQGQFGKRPWETQSTLNETMNQMNRFLGWAGETSELMTRIALRERAIKKGRSPEEATWIARNYLDFAKGGSWTKTADVAIPYLNAGIQATRGIFETAKNDPATASFKVAQVVALGSALAMWNRKTNEEAWDQISDREKVNRWIITTPYSYLDKNGNKRYIYFGIPKDQAQRIFSTIGEEMTEGRLTGKVNYEKVRKSITDFFPVDAASVFPPTVQAFSAYMFNKDFWLNEDVWKGRKVSPKEEYWNTTPELAVLWGEKTGLSPERSRRAFHKVLPQNIYTYMVGGLWKQTFGTLSEKEQIEMSKPFIEKTRDFPLLRKVLRHTWPTGKQNDFILSEADKYQIETTEAGKDKKIEILKREIEEAKIKVADKRIQNDRKFDAMVTAASFEEKNTQRSLESEMDKLKEEDFKEYRRISNRIKSKFPDFAPTFIMKDRVNQFKKGDMSWDKKIIFLNDIKKMKPNKKIEIAKMLGPENFRKLQKDVSGQLRKFEEQKRKLAKDKITMKITLSEYKRKMDLIEFNIKKYKALIKMR